jgi:1-acyl-sn-glycerol-3-phosphate acyltransferase
VTFYQFAVRLVRVILWPFWRPLAEGTENIPEHGGVIVCNHLGTLDPVLLAICMPNKTLHFLAKEELFRVPVLGWLIRKLNAIPVRRKKVDVSAVRKCMRVVNDGGLLVIFPEGTRNRTKTLLPFQEGASFIASRCGTVVYPARIQIGRTNGRRHVTFAPPLDLTAIEPAADKETRLKAMTEALRNKIIDLARKESK